MTQLTSPPRDLWTPFSPGALKAPPRVVSLDGWKVQFLAFATPEQDGAVPVAILGGAFQSFASLRREVAHLSSRHPVLLVDLPSQGSNEQFAPDLSLADFADLLARFLDGCGIPAITPVGLSYGSAIAYTFAARHRARAARCILAGTTLRVRPSLRQLLRVSMETLAQGDHDAFAAASVQHLLNLSQAEQTGLSERILHSLYQVVKGLDAAGLRRYCDNTARLMREELAEPPTCPTLVCSARYDNFIASHESWELAQRCPDGHFALVEHGDHLAPIAFPDTLLALYDAFLDDRLAEGVPDVSIVYPVGDGPYPWDRRATDRVAGGDVLVEIVDGDGRSLRGKLVDVSPDGCRIALAPGQASQLANQEPGIEPLRLRVAGLDEPLYAVALVSDEGLRAFFYKVTLDDAARVAQLIALCSKERVDA
jgi:pimeloyl-ACP methyl ester carboxylesterase